MARVSVSEIARIAKVSPAAAGHVLNGAGKGKIRVSSATRHRIEKVAESLNYRRNMAAQQLAGKRSGLLGVLIDPKPLEINYVRLAAIGARARSLGFRLVIEHQNLDMDRLKQSVDDFAGRQVEGVICVHHKYPGDSTTIPNMLISAVDHVVFIDQPMTEGASFIGVDYTDMGSLILGYLADRGRRRIGLVLPDVTWYSGPRILQGYRDELKRRGLSQPAELTWIAGDKLSDVPSQLDVGLADRIIDDLVVRAGADAIMGSDDYWSGILINRMVERGISVPDDVAVVGQGNYHVSRFIRPMLTTVDFQLEKIGRLAVDMLTSRIKGESQKKLSPGVLVKPQLVERGTA